MKPRSILLLTLGMVVLLALAVVYAPEASAEAYPLPPVWARWSLDPIEGADVYRTIYSSSRPRVKGRTVFIEDRLGNRHVVFLADNRSWILRELER